MGEVFHTRAEVRFAHCDPAGLIFYPRAFELVNGAVEDWFAQGLACTFAELHLQRRLGVPTVRLDAEFTAPARLGETLDFSLRVRAIGGASLDLEIAATVGGAARFAVQPRLVFMNLDTARATPIPEGLRPALSRYLEASP